MFLPIVLGIVPFTDWSIVRFTIGGRGDGGSLIRWKYF